MTFRYLNTRLTQLLSRPGDSEQGLDLKKLLIIFSCSIIPPVGGLTLLCIWWDLPVLKLYGVALLLYYTGSMLLLLKVKSRIAWFYYGAQISSLLITMITVARLGGILQAGGLLFAALASVVFSMVYPRIQLALLTFAGYTLGVILLAIAQPWLVTAPEMLRPNINLFFTAVNSVWISIFILMVIIYVFDQRAKAEQAKNQRLLELDELKTRLYTNITHEFRTPLTIILGAANSQPASLPIEGRGGKFDLIRRNANRLLRLVNQMLNLAKLESGAMPIHKIKGNVLPVLHYFVDSFQSMATRKNVRLHFLSSLPSVEMDYDPDKMEDIIGNLLSNAIKFTPPGGDVYLTADVLEKSEHENQLIIKVRDTGIGISADKLGFIFERFFQIETPDKHVEEGSGIGLTLVKEYVKLLGGTITVQSTTGKGTEFSLALPITCTAEAFAPTPGAQHTHATVWDLETEEPDFAFVPLHASEPTEQAVLLLVEDNAELRHYLQTILAPYYQIQIARNGQEGIERALELVPDIIISDVMMPVKDGFELCRTLKNDFRTNHIPIILLTARADAESKLSGLEKGADAYMAKPFQPKELLLRLRKLIELREKLKIKYSLQGPESISAAAPGTGLDEMFLREARKCLEENYSNEDFGIEELCAALDISRVQLHRKLIALVGQSASHFISNFRLEKAALALKSSRKSVSEIAYEVGFKDANYFTRVFSKQYGVSPGEFRGAKQ